MNTLLRWISPLAVLGSLAVGSSAMQADASPATATVRVLHGIPGQDLGLEPGLPVDVEVNGGVVLSGFEFGEFAGPLSLPAGDYLIEVSLADAQNPGSNAPVISADVSLLAGQDVTIAAHLDAGGAPTATAFVNDASPLPFLQTRVSLHHAAAAPAVDIDLDRRFPRFGGSLNLEDVVNGQAASADLLLGLFAFQATLANTSTVVLGPTYGFLIPGVDYRVYVVGSAQTGSLTLLYQVVRT